ncbi:MAG: Asp-tRNA(Asn)/Glu-tRNA(Gln) amidotransferase subunit GatB [Candidatus Methanoperedens sp.]|nr:Asp-tRNA(Asn)/Glu-tRNA(Gln) amidotransferase subunit GatB [Candidatus Methanoperedens sp.]
MYKNPDGVMIGLEVHVQLNKLKTKIFCGCSTDYHNDPPNSHVCPVCLGLPGSMPVINRKAVEAAIKVGLAFNCTVEERTQFYRKNYFYPDLPKAFQITQYDFPISSNGYVTIEGEDGEHKVRINRAHMEEDPGRLVHEGTIDRSKYTLIDYNRSGMALLEIVSEPDMRSPKEARRYLDKLRNIVEYLEVSNVDLEGAMRVDANISIMGGQRAEIKNISSFKGAERALLFEIVRQKNVLRRGGTVVQETRHFDEAREITLSMRTKEEAHDYRYFPEPDLVPLKISGWAPAIKEALPELPDARRMRFVEQYGITDEHAKSLTSELKVAVFFEDVAQEADPKLAAVWVNDVLKGELNYRNLTIDAFRKEDILSIIGLLSADRITDDGAVDIIRTILDKGGKPGTAGFNETITLTKSPEEIFKEKGLLKVEGDIVETAAQEAIAEKPQAVADYKAGKEKALNSLVGAVMEKTKGRADARTAREILLEKLGKVLV